MEIIADTNLLVRLITYDDERQAKLAQKALAAADLIAFPLSALCEASWVLLQGHKRQRNVVAAALRQILATENVVTDFAGFEAGMSVMEAGGDFADGVIAYEGRKLGGMEFVSFDKTAVKLLLKQGKPARLLS